MSASARESLVTLSQIEKVLKAEIRPARKDWTLPPFVCEYFYAAKRVDNLFKYYSAAERKKVIVDRCQQLFTATEDPARHARSLDGIFAELVECNFVPKADDLDSICREAHGILNRLPPRPMSLPDFTDRLPFAYFNGSDSVDDEAQASMTIWDNLQVVSFVNTNIIRMILLQIIYGYGFVHSLRDVVNATSELIDTSTLLSEQSNTELGRYRWLIVRAFLWTSWQRSRTILAYFRLGMHLKFGYEHHDTKDNWIRSFSPAPQTSVQELTDKLSDHGKVKYMCTWAFELLRSDTACSGIDFQLFHERYSSLFGDHAARCNKDSGEACDGKHSDHCQRFKGLKIEDQSGHDEGCEDKFPGREKQLVWDKQSYCDVQGARAVSIADTDLDQGLIRYCEASDKTLAISHVWSHGQGGRPEKGINLCLHLRYVRIAEKLGCDSYWMDTTCIPKDHRLRKEAISHINGVFAACRASLVCDRDLMEIDVSKLTLPLRESVIAAVLICDWNVRAWTFLEAMKGRQTIHILCKNDAIIPFREMLQEVYNNGRIDLVILCQLTPHLLRWRGHGLPRSHTQRKNDLGDIAVEIGGTLLSYRPASRAGDDIVIWSLLFDGERPCYDAKAFWRSRIGGVVSTGFLISSATRLKVSGLSWAPASPYAVPRLKDERGSAEFYRAFDGIEAEIASIEKEGIFATWLVSEFDGVSLCTAYRTARSMVRCGSRDSEGQTEFDKIRTRFLRTCRFGALLQPASIPEVYRRAGEDVARYQGKVQGTLLAVCGSNKITVSTWRQHESYKWTWKGVYEWPKDVPLPAFEKAEGFCIA